MFVFFDNPVPLATYGPVTGAKVVITSRGLAITALRALRDDDAIPNNIDILTGIYHEARKRGLRVMPISHIDIMMSSSVVYGSGRSLCRVDIGHRAWREVCRQIDNVHGLNLLRTYDSLTCGDARLLMPTTELAEG